MGRTVVGFEVTMENLGSLFLVLPVSSAHATRSSMTAVWMMAVVEGKEDLHEIVPDGIFWNETIMSLSLLDDGGEVATTAEFHEDVEYASIAVYVSVMIAYDVFVMEVLEDVSGEELVWVVVGMVVWRHSHFCDDLFAVALCHALEVEFLAGEDLPATKGMRIAWPTTDDVGDG